MLYRELQMEQRLANRGRKEEDLIADIFAPFFQLSHFWPSPWYE